MRPRGFVLAAACAALIILSAGAGYSLDLGVQTWIGNLGFRNDRTASDVSFPGQDYFWGLSLYGTQSINDTLGFETGFYADPVLRNISYTLFSYHQKVLSVGIGPFFGFFNDWTTLLKSGISTEVRLELPGIVFLGFRSDSSIGGELLEIGDYLQSRSDITFGFYVPNAICTISLESRKFEQKTATAKVIDSLTEYSFSTDIFQKNVPYRLIVSFSYQSLSKSFIAATTSSTVLNSLVIGTEVDISLAESLLLQTGLVGTVYSFGTGTLVGSAGSFLFRAFTGIKLSIDSLPFISQM
jgi:hypothetical protein